MRSFRPPRFRPQGSNTLDLPKSTVVLWASLLLSSPLAAQTPLDAFHWIDFHDPKDAPTVQWVTDTLKAEKWTAIREIGVQWDAAMVVTSERKTTQSAPPNDVYTVWNVSLAKHEAQPLLHMLSPRVLNWTTFIAANMPEIGLIYNDCNDCEAPSTFFTTVYYNIHDHAWRARWVRGDQTALLWSGGAVDGVTRSQVYGLLTDPSGRELLGTWTHFNYGNAKPAEDFVYQYSVDLASGLDQTQRLSDKHADELKVRLCRANPGQADPTLTALARGQDSELCQQSLQAKTKPRSGRRPVTTPPANNRGRSTPPGARQ